MRPITIHHTEQIKECPSLPTDQMAGCTISQVADPVSRDNRRKRASMPAEQRTARNKKQTKGGEKGERI